ncbi:hypothetical protein COHA_007538 [Chlorella ohadii]|uniref:Uncharacterized protein n=1 Tax=Chlorella ohadii TaxID=2649997 RepID=A0AAD5DIN7_9CHLO|nr:hypothetical protein COHA_007538 [Chlorella ohadii]
MPGSVNGGFNSKKKSWQKAKRQKAREVKKRKGVAVKHKTTAVAGVSGKRTKKHQRKVAHAQRVAGKEAAALESAMQVEGASPAKQPAAGKKGKKQQKKAAAAAPAAGDAPEAMQE